jgi:FkbM family methyltransferase
MSSNAPSRALRNRLRRGFAELVVRPYVYRELPGWGPLYTRFVGGYKSDPEWADAGRRNIRGKLHGFAMELDVSQWSQRLTYFLGRYYDLATQLMCEAVLRPGDRVFDVGANIGMITLLGARLVGPSGRVDCVEPNPVCAERLRRVLAANQISNVFVHQCGLSDSPGVLTLSVPSINAGEATFGPSQYADGTVQRIEVPVHRGDDLIEADARLKLIKIDVEGFECRVLDGMQRTLRNARPIVITEVVPEHLERAGFKVADLVDRLRAYDYEPYYLDTRRNGLRHRLHLEQPLPGKELNGDVVWVHMPTHRDLLSTVSLAR